MPGPSTLACPVAYPDPDIDSAPWTSGVEWPRDDSYQLDEFARHEGDGGQEWINASRARRCTDAAAIASREPDRGTVREGK